MALGASFVSAAATPIRQLTNTQASNIRPAWSPDGKQIAFQTNRDGPYHIYVMSADGSNVRQLTSGDADDRHPAWSPDGKQLAIDSGDQTNREIWTIDVGSRQRTQITKLGGIASFPSWSPDGKRIAFYVYQAGSMDVWAAMIDNGSNPLRLTHNLATEENNQCTFACHSVAWSPDSNRLALSDGDSSRVLLMSAVGGAQTPISPPDERSHFPVYLPDGRLVYVTDHISQDQSWTDLWLVDPNSGAPRNEVAREGCAFSLLLGEPLRAPRRFCRRITRRSGRLRIGRGEVGHDIRELIEDQLKLVSLELADRVELRREVRDLAGVEIAKRADLLLEALQADHQAIVGHSSSMPRWVRNLGALGSVRSE